MSGAEETSFKVGSLTSSIYAPNLLFSIGQGAAIPVLALLALDLGASPAVAGVIVGMQGLGTLVCDLPAGWLVSRIGDKRSMIGSGAALALIAFAIWLRPPLPLYAVLVALMGCTWSVWLLARIAHAARSAPAAHRGRVMALIGGLYRIGQLIGPVLGSVILVRGDLTGPFLILAILALAASATMALSRSPRFTREPVEHSTSVLRILREHRRTFVTAGTVAVTTQVLRAARAALIPLWGHQLGISAGTISILFAAGAAIESLMFYPVGMLMDRKGRKWTAVPSIALLSVGMAMIPLTDDTASLTIIVLLLGLANGLGSGMNMTLGSDLSPLAGRSRFLGLWRLMTDFGTTGGPLLLAAVTTLASLGAAAVTVGGVGIVGVMILVWFVPETLEPAE
jgi:MFS family permease